MDDTISARAMRIGEQRVEAQRMHDAAMSPTIFDSIDSLERSAGMRVAESPWLTVTQAMIDDFARLTNDAQWIHVDVERARRESPYGAPIAHGFLTLSLLTPLIESAIDLRNVRFTVNYGFDRVRFISGVPAGSEIAATFAIERVERLPDGARVAWLAEVRVRGAVKPALSAVWLSRVYAHGDDPLPVS